MYKLNYQLHLLDGSVSYKKHSICGANLGCYCCRKKDRESEFAHYGPGVVIYFQFVKYMMWLAVIISLLAIPKYILYYSGNVMSRQNTQDLNDIFSSFTLGNLG